MSSQQLFKPITTGGIHSTNFFNGRRLTAEDLIREKKASREHERLLGQAIGEGVVCGLEVGLPGGKPSGGTTLEIQKGLAINRNGEALYLPDRINLPLVPPPDEENNLENVFSDCESVKPKSYPSNAGVYVLLISSATELTGSAPMSSIPDNGSIIGCGKSELVEGVQFRVVKMDLNGPAFEGLKEDTKKKLYEVADKIDDMAKVSMFRNIVAHACFGTEEKEKFMVGPFENDYLIGYGAIDRLRSLDDNAPSKITDCDVPLAFFYWTFDGIAYCDLWSVRRQIATRNKILRRQADFVYPSVQQFHEHLHSYSDLVTIESSDYFLFLPPFGQLPVKEPRYGSFSGIELKKFFGSKYNRLPSVIGAGEFKALYRAALNQIPHHTTDISRIEIFYIAENIKALFEGTEEQLIGFFSFAEINAIFCPSLNVISDGVTLNQSSFEALFEASYLAYQDFRRMILLYALAAGAQPTKQDILGLEAINQVLHTASSALSGLTAGCMTNHRLWESFKRFADQEKQFANTWLDIVLAQEDGERYLAEIRDLIEEVKRLIESEEVDGFRGLLSALNDHDLFSAYLAQQKISQRFARDIGAGPRGVITINYSIAPVVVGEAEGDSESSEIGTGKYLFGFTFNARVDREATFHLKPRIEAFGWDVELWDEEEQQPRSSEFITMPKSDHLPDGESRDVFVRVTVTELGESVAELIFDVEEVSGAGGVPKASDSVTFEIGAEIPRPEDRVLIVLDSYGNATPREGGIAIGRNTISGVQFILRVTVPGRFNADIKPADGRPWTQLELSTEQFVAPDGTSPEAPYIEVTAAIMKPGSEARNTELIFIVSSESEDVDPPIKERFRLSVYIE